MTLTILAGAVVKFSASTRLTIYGTLDVNGAAGNEVVFTSLKDDTYGGDTNGDGSATSPAPGDWKGIYLDGSGSYEGIGEFDYCRIRYGGYSYGGTYYGNVYFSSSDSGHFTNSVSEYSENDGVEIYDCSPTITNSTLANNTTGLAVSYGNPIVTNCTFWVNSSTGIYSSSASPIITNCILWWNGDDLYGCTATYSDIEDGDAGDGYPIQKPR